MLQLLFRTFSSSVNVVHFNDAISIKSAVFSSSINIVVVYVVFVVSCDGWDSRQKSIFSSSINVVHFYDAISITIAVFNRSISWHVVIVHFGCHLCSQTQRFQSKVFPV